MHAHARRLAATLAALASLATAAPAAQAQATSFFMAFLVGANEVPPAASPGFGVAFLGYDLRTNQFEISTTFTALSSPPTAADVHRGAAGTEGPVVVDVSGSLFSMPIPPFGFAGGTTPFVGFLSAADELALFAGELYVNVHSEGFPEGEIRGQLLFFAGEVPQVVPEPATVLLLGSGIAVLGLTGLGRRRLAAPTRPG